MARGVLVLDRIHVLVGQVEDFVQGFAIGPASDSDAEANGAILEVSGVVPVIQVKLYSLKDSLRVFDRSIGKNGEEFVAAVANHGIAAANGCTEEIGNFRQDEITGQMSKACIRPA